MKLPKELEKKRDCGMSDVETIIKQQEKIGKLIVALESESRKVEKQAKRIKELESVVAKLREALEYYSKTENWMGRQVNLGNGQHINVPAFGFGGYKAIVALEETKGVVE